jgi:hypothetical protein
VLQNAQVDTLPDGRRVALLVGMAGRSHWSLAAELTTSAATERLTLDVACRFSARPERLGSRYRLGAAVEWDAACGALRTASGSADLRVERETLISALKPGEVEFCPESLGSPTATTRWKFTVETCSGNT